MRPSCNKECLPVTVRAGLGLPCHHPGPPACRDAPERAVRVARRRATSLCRAQQVADRIVPAYATPTRIPLNIINLATQEAKNPTWNQKWVAGGQGGVEWHCRSGQGGVELQALSGGLRAVGFFFGGGGEPGGEGGTYRGAGVRGKGREKRSGQWHARAWSPRGVVTTVGGRTRPQPAALQIVQAP